MEENKVSVIVPVYNVGKYIRECLKSIVDQTYKNIEVIVIIDGSEDDSESIVDEYCRKYDYFRKYNQDNYGLSSARNLALKYVTGDFVIFVDSDDLLFENSIDILINAQKENNSDIVIGNIYRYYKRSSWQNLFFKKDLIKCNYKFKPNNDKEKIIRITNSVCGKLFSVSLLHDSKVIFLPGYKYEDLLFTFSLIAENPLISFIEDKVYLYRIRKNSIMTDDKSLLDIVTVSRKLIEFYDNRDLLNEYHDELWFVVMKHSIIGGSFRSFNASIKIFNQMLKENKKLLDDYKIYIKKNKYFNEYNIFYRVYFNIINIYFKH